ncbi:hypothetical protein [Paludisphaera borealis]|uniref:hypothetical protein n=1 Tax=Paludisphaera borealis TaxID=1387353 RepID=UPI002852B4AE|nr:hypothetical protein [Paludisphaera borealis]
MTKIGKPCHVMARTWVIETDEPLDNLFKILSTSVFAGNEGGFLVAPLAGDWSCRNAKTKDDCYRRV